MKINDQSIVKPSDIGLPAASRPALEHRPEAAPASSGAPAARVELSSRSRELHEARRLADAAPDVRTDKVEAARTRIENGTYAIDPERIARGMLDRRA